MNRINRIVESVWTGKEIWSEFVDSMRHAIESDQPENNSAGQAQISLLKLPQLCCQAAGGDPFRADDLTAAWVLFYIAADLMDAVEDGDPPEAWWAKSEPGLALNTASGLYFTASLALNNLYNTEATRPAAGEVAQVLYQSFLKMSSGQHLDLTVQEPSLEQCWKIAAAKSGAFFAAGSWAGARLATQDAIHLGGYERFGYHLGLLIQIFDDLEVIKLLNHPVEFPTKTEIFHSFGIAYSLEVLPIEDRNLLRTYLQTYPQDPTVLSKAWCLLEESGAGLYLRAEIERHQALGMEALREAQPLPPADKIIVSFLKHRRSTNSGVSLT